MADAGVTGNSQLSATKQDIITEMVQRELISKGVLAGTILDVSRFAVKGAQTIAFPKAGSFTAENRGTAAQATKQALTFDKDQLSLNFRATVLYLVDAMDELESVVDVEAEYAKRAASAHAVYLEQQIIAELSNTALKVTDASGDISDAAILSMRKTLMKHKANMSQLCLAISPDQESIMLGIEKFVSAFIYGQSNVPNGQIGTVYGVPVKISTELGAQEFYMYDKEGICLGFQRGPQMDQRKAPEYGAGSMLTVIDQKFGVKGLELAQQGMASGISALIVSDNN